MGFCSVEVPSSPKVHAHDSTVPSPSLLASVKAHTRSVQEIEKEAVGGVLAVTETDRLVLPVAPSSSLTFKLTV